MVRRFSLLAAALVWAVLGFLVIDFFGFREARPSLLPVVNVLTSAANVGVVLLLAAAVVAWLPVYKAPWVIEVATGGIAVGFLTICAAEVALLAALSPIAGAIFAIPPLAYVAYWAPASHREVEVMLEEVLPAPPETVFRATVDPELQLRLLPELKSVEVVGGGPLGKGTRLRSRARSGPALVAAVDEIVEFDPPRRVAYSTRSGARSNQGTFEFEPDEAAGGTRVRYSYRAVLSFPSALVGGYMRGTAAERILELRRRWFDSLRIELGR